MARALRSGSRRGRGDAIMICAICGAKCVCKKAGAAICCSCHKHKARSPLARLGRELAHAAAVAARPREQGELEL